MSQDQRERDRLLTETHTNVSHMVKWSEDHDKVDTTRFDEVNDKIDFQQKIVYGLIGAAVFVEFITKVIK